MRFARCITGFAFVALAVAAVVSCSSVNVSQDYDPTTDFSKLGKYAWMNGGAGGGDIDQLTAQRIVRAVDDELRAKGFEKDTSAPDFLVNFLASVQQKIETRPTTVSVGYGWRHGYAGVASGTEIDAYDEGTLVLDFVDPASKSLLWRGTARGAVQAHKTPEERKRASATSCARFWRSSRRRSSARRATAAASVRGWRLAHEPAELVDIERDRDRRRRA